jgi:pyrimidine-specific ribonucleoside hydrolase
MVLMIKLWVALLVVMGLGGCAGATPAGPRPTATPFVGTARPVIIDTDMAADDWLAILFVLQRQDLAVQAITVTGAGEAHCEAGVRNALDLAALAGQPEIPVACGRETPLRGTHTFPETWRTNVDALLGLELPANGNGPAAQSAPALISDLAAGTAQPLTLLTLGPLTNVAEALEADPALAGRLGMIYVMGGAVDAPGNVAGSGVGLEANTTAEWNFYVDPHAARVVLEAGAPVTLVALDATNAAPVTLDFVRRLRGARHTPEAQFVYDVLEAQSDFIGGGGYYFWDPLAAAILAEEGLATYETRALTVVEAEGNESGRVAAAQAGPGVRLATGADATAFEALFVETLNAVWP